MDFQEHGMDLEVLVEQRTWRWFRLRTMSLVVDKHTRIHQAITRREKSSG